jgi:uncharacterized protein related to proFAR isomerase
MNTDKLIKAIQILVKEEIKSVLPTLVKEAVKAETAKLLKENKELKKQLVSQRQPTTPTFMDVDLSENNNLNVGTKKTYTKNSVINDILNQTQPFSQTGMNESVLDRTMTFTTQNVPMGGGIAPDLRAQMAAQMGYGDFNRGPQPSGLGVQTGNESLDKALNRDYSELVKRFKK